MKQKSKNIVFISSIAWDYAWHRQQEIMYVLSNNGFKILFIEPVNKRKLSNIGMEKIKENLWVLHVTGLPYERCFYFINFINGKILNFFLRNFLKKIDFNNYTIWFDRIHGCDYSKFLSNYFVVYDLVDEILAFGRFKNKKLLLNMENNVLKRCDLLLSSSKTLLNRKIKQSGRDGENIFLPNGVDCHRFFLIDKKKLSNQVVVGFVGTISSRALDFALLQSIFQLRPNWKFIFVGPSSFEEKKYLNSKNVIVLEAVEGKEIPKIISNFDVGIIPYNIEDERMDYVFPRKACEYLSAGIPVVSTPLKEIEIFKPYVRIANSPKNFVQEIENVLYDNISFDERRNFVKQFDWNILVNKLIDKIS